MAKTADIQPKFFRPTGNNKFTYQGPSWAGLSEEGKTERIKEGISLNISYSEIGRCLKAPGENNGRSAVAGHALRHIPEDERPAKKTPRVQNGRSGPKSNKRLPRGHASVKRVESVVVEPIAFDFSPQSLAPHLYGAPAYRPESRKK